MVSQEVSDGWARYWHNYGNRHGLQAASQIHRIDSKGAPTQHLWGLLKGHPQYMFQVSKRDSHRIFWGL